MSKQPVDLSTVRSEYINFPADFESVLIGTASSDGLPDASYAAYLAQDKHYYVYVSELSKHTQNLRDTGKASLLFIESESECQHLFARRRVTLACEVEEVFRWCRHFDLIMDQFIGKFGQFMNVLKSFNDFHLFKITPQKGVYVRGFGQAYTFEGESLEMVKHLNDQGHRAKGKTSSSSIQLQAPSS
ncbi:MAG TPA: pyridoxamine 5'-phosphate oxidase [Gammaproteobacteria bacterium]|jgi:Putative heme iron utilization protein|nr:pyridoxamine 5'-phosphate oxidase [Gammaproteobacteria bacterium]